MIYSVLMDLNNGGDLYRLLIESDNLTRTLKELLKYSDDVRYVDAKEEPGKKDKGIRVLADGSVVRRCQFFGSKVGYNMRFATSEYKLNTIKKARDAREVIANGR
ncbi:hypothetical protein SELR_pSRC300730 (plasmid) [Selenomonas ruminantium subsp. lactilytica TAM6421]|uniref:Uncharacterized protein n=1 Tax=Selenomonas ruminantium subsp. lactilytica (strain NBRC 103574 / TAM6421) TaxID=927704 RepID=I0GWK9_SELRL|nr:hypothetical protein [Selenomonas ruminantium]BAL85146.1 hypothetical protein SELR_pSRC300730 [Selenomonas ruminantium subsp. lactilytica TAM6421]